MLPNTAMQDLFAAIPTGVEGADSTVPRGTGEAVQDGAVQDGAAQDFCKRSFKKTSHLKANLNTVNTILSLKVVTD